MHLLRLINHLDRNQFQISVALARRGGSYESDLAVDVKVYHLETGTINSSTLQMLRAIQPLRRTISNEQPDILCSVLDHANNAAVLATRRLASPPKTVLSVQNTQTLSNKGGLVSRLLLWLTPHLYPKANRVVALSKGVAKDIKTLVPDLSDRIEVIYNAGLDTRVFRLANEPLPSENLPENSPLIVACGRLIEQKGFSYLLEALAQVRQRISAHLWIVGKGKLRQQLEEQIRQLGLSGGLGAGHPSWQCATTGFQLFQCASRCNIALPVVPGANRDCSTKLGLSIELLNQFITPENFELGLKSVDVRTNCSAKLFFDHI